MSHRTAYAAWTILVLVGPACNGWEHEAVKVTASSGSAVIKVVDPEGAGVAGAEVTLAARSATTDATGRATFTETVEGGYVAVAVAPGIGRGVGPAPVRYPPGGPAVVENVVSLDIESADQAHLLFAGEISFDGGLSDPNRDGIDADSLVPPGAAATAGVTDLLSAVRPFFDRFDLVTATLGTTLGDGATPHPLKRDRSLAPPEVAAALRASRVDVLNLGTAHAYDYLDDGVAQTLDTLDRIALDRFGAGRDATSARAPSLLGRLGVTIGQVSLSALVGKDMPERLSYEARDMLSFDQPAKAGVIEATPDWDLPGSDAPHAGSVRCATCGVVHGLGARLCPLEDCRASFETKASADVVVAHIAAGVEWDATATDEQGSLAANAAAGGAVLVVGNGPRPMGRVFRPGGASSMSVAVTSLGQLVFGSNRPEGRTALLLEAVVRGRSLAGARLWPLVLAHHRPAIATGALGARILRRVGAASVADMGTMVGSGLEVVPSQGRAEVSPLGLKAWRQATHRSVVDLRDVEGADGAREGVTPAVALLGGEFESFLASASATVAAGASHDLAIELGREVLWEGGFEDEAALGPGLGRGTGWSFNAPDAGPSDASAHGGRLAMELVRKSGNIGAASVRGVGLLALDVGRRYTFSGCWRLEGAHAPASVGLGLYADRALHTVRSATRAAPAAPPGGAWTCFAVDYTPNKNELVTPEIELSPPARGTARLFVDDLSLIAWDPRGGGDDEIVPVPNEFEYARVRAPEGGGKVALAWTTRRQAAAAAP